MMIYHGFHFDQDKQLNFNGNHSGSDRALSWKRLALGFGMSGAILCMIALLFMTTY